MYLSKDIITCTRVCYLCTVQHVYVVHIHVDIQYSTIWTALMNKVK